MANQVVMAKNSLAEATNQVARISNMVTVYDGRIVLEFNSDESTTRLLVGEAEALQMIRYLVSGLEQLAHKSPSKLLARAIAPHSFVNGPVKGSCNYAGCGHIAAHEIHTLSFKKGS